MATQNPPQSHEKTAEGTMAFYGINGILGTGGGKTASRGKQRRNQELITPDQGKKKIRTALLQKIFHYSTFSCIRPSRSKNYSWLSI
jgi:hypothetical protein